MDCFSCGQPAERSCTRCGRFFCESHGGDRLVGEGARKGRRIVTRAVCDNCTPNQEWMAFQRGCGIVVFVIVLIVLAITLFSIFSQ